MMQLTASSIGRRLAARAAVVAIAIGTAVLAVQSPSLADDAYFTRCSSSNISCQTGVEVSGPSGQDTCETDGPTNTRVCINYAGDIMFVRDGSTDSNSAMGLVLASAGVAERWCRNAHGSGTWARCNFDWSETAVKDVYGGIRIDANSFNVGLLWRFING
jgi:hypothetical protein